MRLFFTQLFASERKQIAFMASQKSPMRISDCLFANKSLRNEDIMTTKEYIEEAESSLLHTYNRYQIVLEKGDGAYLYDTDGKKYLDFAAGIAVFAFG